MSIRLRKLLIPGLALLAAGCGPSKVAVKPGAIKEVREVALIRVAEPPAYVAQDFGHPGMMFGAIGGAAAGSSSANAGKNVNQLATAADFRAGERMTARLRDRLKAAGFQVRVVDVPAKTPTKPLQDIDAIDAGDADAVLDVTIQSIGYATEHPMFSPHWRPSAQVQVALFDRRDRQTLYSEKFMYGYHNPLLSGTDLDAPEAYHFKDKDALFADRDVLIQGMAQGIDSIADAIVSNIHK